MSDLSLNKYLGAGLSTAFVIASLAVVVPMIFEKTPPAKPGYAIAAVDDSAGGEAAVADTPPDWGTVLPTADIAAGQAVSGKCTSCHTFDPAAAKGPQAPNLVGVMGRKPGSSPGFAGQYSAAMEDFGNISEGK